MGTDPFGNPTGLPGLSRPPSPYLLVYDAESPACRALVDWVRKRDPDGLVVSFPYQNTELLHVAPEFAGMVLDGEVHGFDTRSRVIHHGPRLLPELLRRLPGWRRLILAPLATVPVAARIIYRYLRRHRSS